MHAMFKNLYTLLVITLLLPSTFAFPQHASLAGLSEDALAKLMPSLGAGTNPGLPPAPLRFNGTKLVNDKAHPWKPLRKGDLRGPCPGLNTLASHGYLPRNGVATPAQIIQAAQEGFNMENSIARFATYSAHLVDGNLVTDLLSIGAKTRLTGPDPPRPALAGGLNTHAVFEGDASMTRGDDFFGDNHSFNQTLFDQFIDFSNRYGDGFYNLTVAQELRWELIQQSIATNPNFDFTSPRFFTAYGESTFPFTFFVDGRHPVRALSMENATLFFRDSKFPEDFWRLPSPTFPVGVQDLFRAHPIEPGRNVNGVNTYTPDPNSASFDDVCLFYANFVNITVKSLYPNPKGLLRRNLLINLRYFYESLPPALNCTEQFPYGRS